jgi:hypothetical protein
MSIQRLSVPFFLSDTEVNKLESIVAHPRWALLATCFHPGFLLGLFIDPEDGGDIFLRDVSLLSTDYSGMSQKVELVMHNLFSKMYFL